MKFGKTSVRRLNAIVMESEDKEVRVRYDVAAGLAQLRTVGADGRPWWWTWELPRRLAGQAKADGLEATAEWLEALADHQEDAATKFFAANGRMIDDND